MIIITLTTTTTTTKIAITTIKFIIDTSKSGNINRTIFIFHRSEERERMSPINAALW